MVGAFAAALDDGEGVSEAFRASITTGGWVESSAEESSAESGATAYT
jgi:hypothetical protein